MIRYPINSNNIPIKIFVILFIYGINFIIKINIDEKENPNIIAKVFSLCF